MNTGKSRISLALLLGICIGLQSLTHADSPGPQANYGDYSRLYLNDAPRYSGIDFSVVVFREVGWNVREVRRVLREASDIYAHACYFSLNLVAIRYLDVDQSLHRIDEYLQQQLLASLDGFARPTLFFVGDTHAGDFAYAYLEGTASPSQGTAWMSRRVPKRCRGRLLAHEIGHIALNTGRHSKQPENLMQSHCRDSNLDNHMANTGLSDNQCQILWRRYGS